MSRSFKLRQWLGSKSGKVDSEGISPTVELQVQLRLPGVDLIRYVTCQCHVSESLTGRSMHHDDAVIQARRDCASQAAPCCLGAAVTPPLP
eukprot:1328625-Rhodomonas_salina.1